MAIIFLALAIFIGLALLASLACERELLRDERAVKPQHRKAA
jgi:hypothetical protein